MMRSLYTAASGMIAQQTNVDVISNNLANVNTAGYKNATAEFKTLLYQTLQSKTTSANGENKPVGAQVGTGARNSSITTHFTQGTFSPSSNPYACAIDGNGFFAVKAPNNETYYTRNGDFKIGVTSDGGYMVCTSEGYPVLDSTGAPIEFDSTYNIDKMVFSSDGSICYQNEKGTVEDLGIDIGLYQFTNPSGLSSVSGSMYKETSASGVPANESEDTTLKQSKIKTGCVEASNVQVVDEMVNLIVAQRAYEMNSKAIQASDDMLSQANNLKR